jgi:hypothetical protein
MKRLLEIGFIKVGYWELVNNTLHYHLDPEVKNQENVLYCFSSRGRVKYIGKTIMQFWVRMEGYKYPGESSSTNNFINYEIYSLLVKGEKVYIFILSHNRKLSYHGYKINLAAGLEDILIHEIDPKWNKKGTKASTAFFYKKFKRTKILNVEERS